MVSRLFGQLAARRHLISGMLCAIAGAARVLAAATPRPAVARNLRLSMDDSSEVAALACFDFPGSESSTPSHDRRSYTTAIACVASANLDCPHPSGTAARRPLSRPDPASAASGTEGPVPDRSDLPRLTAREGVEAHSGSLPRRRGWTLGGGEDHPLPCPPWGGRRVGGGHERGWSAAAGVARKAGGRHPARLARSPPPRT